MGQFSFIPFVLLSLFACAVCVGEYEQSQVIAFQQVAANRRRFHLYRY